MALWPQWRSPLVWDVFAVSTYATVSLLFWYVGLIPDLATLRDRATNRFARIIYGDPGDGLARLGAALAPLPDGLPAAGRPGDAAGRLGPHRRQLRLRRRASCPAGTRRSSRPTSSPGRSSPGFAMVLTLAIPLRAVSACEDFITMRHLENMAKVMLATGLIVAYGY